LKATRRYGLVGKRLDHSFSKKYFTEKFIQNSIDASYENIEIDDFTHLKESITEKKINGFNITIPYKKNIVEAADKLSKTVQEIGAANCIKISKNGNWIAHNTDVIGFEKSLLTFLKKERPNALIFGTGGASQAVQFVLKRLNISFQIVSRTKKGACLQYKEINKKIISENKLLINTTPLGTFPNIENSIQIPYKFLSKAHFCFDLIYNPKKTEFLTRAADRGAQIKNGLEMLEVQAEESWKIWNS